MRIESVVTRVFRLRNGSNLVGENDDALACVSGLNLTVRMVLNITADGLDREGGETGEREREQ